MNLNYIRDSIEAMNHQNHVDILKILVKHKDICINSNKSGIRINLTELKPAVIDELIKYIKYIQTQENALKIDEKQKENYKNEYFSER
jgi:hypothetical protein